MGEIATEKVYVEDANGIRRLVAVPGDVIPEDTPTFGVVTRRDAAAAAAEPFEGYDSLSEQQVLDRLADLSPDELEAVKAYERAHLARGSIHTYGDEPQKPVDMPRPRRKTKAPADGGEAA
jgi:hypothetical protein